VLVFVVLQAHALSHMEDVKKGAVFVFVCPFCNESAMFVAFSKRELIEHLTIRHNAYK
jgi:hypothetical protein